MPESERQVRDWRSKLEGRSTLTRSELDELEDHLRANVERMLRADPGLTAARAFEIARSALGRPRALSREFARAGYAGWRPLLLLGWVLYGTSFFLSSAFAPIHEYGYEFLLAVLADGAFVLALPNLAMITTFPALRRVRPKRRRAPWDYLGKGRFAAVGISGLATLGLGVKTLVIPPQVVVDGASSAGHLGPAYWVWSASFAVVAGALWLRDRGWDLQLRQPAVGSAGRRMLETRHMFEARERVTTPWALLLAAATGSSALAEEAGAQDVAGAAAGWTVSARPERVYGWLEAEPDSEFSYVVGVVHGPDGRIAVADRTLSTISVLASDGKVVATMGREGDGPGEFRRLTGIAANGEGRLVAFDDDLQRLTEWTFAGSLVGTTRLDRAGGGRRIGEVGRFADGSWYAREGDRLVATDPSGVGRDTVGFHRLREDGVVGDVLGRVPGSVSSQFAVEGMPGIRLALLSPRALGAVSGNCLLVAASDEPTVRIFDRTGTARGEVSLDIAVERATESHREQWVEATAAQAGREMGGAIVPEAVRMIEGMAEAVGMAERVPFANDLVVDDLGYIWTQSYQLPDGAGSPEWRVFTETGQPIGVVEMPEGLRALAITQDTVTGVRTDELGRQFVQLHALDRRGDIERRPLPPGCA